MSDVYTLGVWRVKQDKRSEFIEAWKEVGPLPQLSPFRPANARSCKVRNPEHLRVVATG